MESMEDRTELNTRLGLWIAFDYGGRAELVEATRRIAESGMDPREIDENVLAANLYAPELPDPDLLIRTSGELRVSNFMLWQLAYAELVFVDRLWPDFDARDLRAALAEYAKRRRRFGGTMSNAVSRLVVAAAAIPIVLGLVYLGGWWLFALVAVAAGSRLHEFWLLARPLSPLSPAGYLGGVLALLGAQIGGPGLDDRRRAHRVPAGVRAEGDLGVASGADGVDLGDRDGRGLGRLRALVPAARARPAGARTARHVHRCARDLGGRHVRVLRRAAARTSPNGAEHLAGQDLGGVRVRYGGDAVRRVRRALQGETSSRSASRSSSAP